MLLRATRRVTTKDPLWLFSTIDMALFMGDTLVPPGRVLRICPAAHLANQSRRGKITGSVIIMIQMPMVPTSKIRMLSCFSSAIQDAIHVWNSQYCHSNYGPTFGNGHDLHTFRGTVKYRRDGFELNGSMIIGSTFNNHGLSFHKYKQWESVGDRNGGVSRYRYVSIMSKSICFSSYWQWRSNVMKQYLFCKCPTCWREITLRIYR
jgi:hypothetical protein